MSTGTQSQENASLPFLTAELQTIRYYTKQICDKQGPSPAPLPARDTALVVLAKWLEQEGVVNNAVKGHQIRK